MAKGRENKSARRTSDSVTAAQLEAKFKRLHSASPDKVDLDLAVDEKILSERSRTKAEAFSGLDEAFKDVLAKESREGQADWKAFMRAFYAVYGKLRLEEDSESGKKGTPLDDYFRLVCANNGEIRQRNECHVAASACDDLGAINTEAEQTITTLTPKLADANAKYPGLQSTSDTLDSLRAGVKKLTDESYNSATVESFVAARGRVSEASEAYRQADVRRGELDTEVENSKADADAYFRKVRRLGQVLGGLRQHLDGHGYTELSESVTPVLDRLKGFDLRLDVDEFDLDGPDGWRKFMAGDLSDLVSKLEATPVSDDLISIPGGPVFEARDNGKDTLRGSSLKGAKRNRHMLVAKNIFDKVVSISKELDADVDKVSRCQGAVDQVHQHDAVFKSAKSNLTECNKAIEDGPDKIVDEITSVIDTVADLAGDDLEQASPDIARICAEFLDDSADFLGKFARGEVPPEELINFVNVRLSGFLGEVRSKFDALDADLKSQLGDLRVAIPSMEQEIARCKEIVDRGNPLCDVLKSATPGLRIDRKTGRMSLYGFHKPETGLRKLASAVDYLTDDDAVEELKDGMAALMEALKKIRSADGSPSTEIETLLMAHKVSVDESGRPLNLPFNRLVGKLEQIVKSKEAISIPIPPEPSYDLTNARKAHDEAEARRIANSGKPGTPAPFNDKQAIADMNSAYEIRYNDAQRRRSQLTEELTDLRQALKQYQSIVKLHADVHAKMKVMMGHIGIADQAGVKLDYGVIDGPKARAGFRPGGMPDVKKIDVTYADVAGMFSSIDLDSTDFDPSNLVGVYDQFGGFFEDEGEVGAFAARVENVRSSLFDHTDRTDAQSSRNVLEAIAKFEIPGISDAQAKDFAVKTLDDGCSILNSRRDAMEMAKAASGKKLDVMRALAFKTKLIGFRVGEKGDEPFKEFKPEDFKDWPTLDTKLKRKNKSWVISWAPVMIACFKMYEGKQGDIVSEQRDGLEDYFENLIVEKRLKAHPNFTSAAEAMGNSGFNELVKSEVEARLGLGQVDFEKFNGQYDRAMDDGRGMDVALKIDRKLKLLKLNRRLRNVGPVDYKLQFKSFLEEAEEAGVLDRLREYQGWSGPANAAAMSGWANSDGALWFRDLGRSTADWLKAKAKGFSMMGAIGALKTGFGITTRAAVAGVAAPFGIGYALAHWGGKGIANLGLRALHIFKRTKLTPPSVKNAVLSDLGKVGSWIAGGAKKAGAGLAKGTSDLYTSEVASRTIEKEAAARAKKDEVAVKTLEAEIKELEEKTKLSGVDVETDEIKEISAMFDKKHEDLAKFFKPGGMRGDNTNRPSAQNRGQRPSRTGNSDQDQKAA